MLRLIYPVTEYSGRQCWGKAKVYYGKQSQGYYMGSNQERPPGTPAKRCVVLWPSVSATVLLAIFYTMEWWFMYNTDRGLRRKRDFAHALRKKRHERAGINFDASPWYDNLHQYSKNKIHCSCWMCNRRKSSVSAGNNCIRHFSISDQRKIQQLNAEFEEAS